MPSHKVSMRASMSNQTTHFGIMGGLFNRKISGRSSMNRVTSRLEIPASAKEGYQYMKMHNLLSRNPLGSGGVGRMFTVRPRGSGLGSSGLGSSDTLGDAQIIGPYLHLITDVLWNDGSNNPVVPFIMNIQYYNQGDYYTTYKHLFSDTAGGPYSMKQSSSINAIYKYFKEKYTTNTPKPEDVLKTIILGKPISRSAASNGFISFETLKNWFATWNNAPQPLIGGYMFWSAGFLPEDLSASSIVRKIDSNPEYKVIYIGAGKDGHVYGANKCDTDASCEAPSGKCINTNCQYQAYGADPNGENIKTLLNSYADASFNILILSFWNYNTTSDWVSDWADVSEVLQSDIIKTLHSHPSKPKILVSGGGAKGVVGSKSGVAGKDWGEKLAKFAIDNHLDGVDLDLEGDMLGTSWSNDNYTWAKDAIVAIQNEFKSKDKIISFAPVAPLCANPGAAPPPATKYSCSSAKTCVVDSNGTYTTSNCDNKCSGPPPSPGECGTWAEICPNCPGGSSNCKQCVTVPSMFQCYE